MKRSRKIFALLGLAVLAYTNPSWSGEFRYRIVEIPPLQGREICKAYGINDHGQVVGRSYNEDIQTGEKEQTQAFLWDRNHGTQPLPALSGESGAWDINDNGLVAGYAVNSEGVERAALWDSKEGTVRDLGTLTNPNTGQRGSQSYAYGGINSYGHVVGNADIPNDEGDFTPFHAFLYDGSNGIRDLGTLNTTSQRWQYGYSIAYDINDQGKVVGIAHTDSWAFHAFIYDKTGGLRELKTRSGYTDSEWYATAINEAGLIGGHLTLTSEDKAFPFYWQNESAIPEPVTMGKQFPYGEIYAVNASGTMVGIMWNDEGEEHAFLFRKDTGLRDLNDCVAPGEGNTLIFARDINDAGEIVGYALLNGNKRGFLLTAQAGDIDFNGRIEIKDAIMAVLAASDLSSPVMNPWADVNGDGKTGMEEIVYVLQVVSGLKEPF